MRRGGSALGNNGSTWRWRKIRARILKRDRRLCHYCGGYANTVDHLMPRILGGTDHPSNLVACCARHQNPKRRPAKGEIKPQQDRHATAVSSPPLQNPALPTLRGTITKDPA